MISYVDSKDGSTHEIKAGMFGLSRIGGTLGKLIAAGQAFSGDTSRWTHAFIVLDDLTVIEAMPGGARIVPIADRLAHDEVAFSDQPMQDWLADYMADLDPKLASGLTDRAAFVDSIERMRRDDIVSAARGLNGVGYGYLQYLAIGLVALGFEPRWLRKYISGKTRMICSQLVDEVYRRANIQVFDDGRLPQDVTPGDLAIRYGII